MDQMIAGLLSSLKLGRLTMVARLQAGKGMKDFKKKR